MERFEIAVLPGDGVGPEVMAQARRVLDALASRHGFAVDIREGLIGQSAIDSADRALPPETLRICKDADAVLMGPVGGSTWDDALSTAHPKQAVIKLRAWLNSYATLRRLRGPDDMDVAIVYDNSSGLFYGSPRGIKQTPHGRVATNTEVYSENEAERTLRLAFEVARVRNARLHEVDNAKYLETGQIWRDVCKRLAARYDDVRVTHQDAAHFFFDFARDPGAFDVIVTEMVLGHLISSMAAGRTGSLDIHAAAYLGGDVGLFQPSHGSLPEQAGKGVANPLGMIRAVALLLRLGLGLPDVAVELDDAIEQVVSRLQGMRDPLDDTVSMANAVLEALPRRGMRPAAL